MDNARTHTAQMVNINDFQLKPGGKCLVNFLNYKNEAGEIETIQCFDEYGVSKGLKIIAQELNLLFFNTPLIYVLKISWLVSTKTETLMILILINCHKIKDFLKNILDYLFIDNINR